MKPKLENKDGRRLNADDVKSKSLRLTHKFSNGCTATTSLTRKRKHSGSGQILYDQKPPGYDEKEAWGDFFEAIQGSLGSENGGRKLDFSIYGCSEEERNGGHFSAKVFWRKHEPHPMASDGYSINLVMPVIIWPSEQGNPIAVNIDSPKSHRIAVRKLAQFFRREFHYDFVQYDEDDGDSACVAYLWAAPDCILENWRIHCIGACCFRHREKAYALQWVWMNPFFRCRGLLSEAWPRFEKAHGDFQIEPPLSYAMEGFLTAIGDGAHVKHQIG